MILPDCVVLGAHASRKRLIPLSNVAILGVLQYLSHRRVCVNRVNELLSSEPTDPNYEAQTELVLQYDREKRPPFHYILLQGAPSLKKRQFGVQAQCLIFFPTLI